MFTTSVAAAAILVTAAAAGAAAAWPGTATARQPAGGRFAAVSAGMAAPSARPRRARAQPQLDGYQRLDRQLQQVKAMDARAQEASAALRARQAAAARRARASRQAAQRQAALRSAAAASQAQQSAAPTIPSGSPQRIAMSMLGSYGWPSSQFSCLNSLWNAESGWNPAASNPSSGAYGIPQALPGSKMASAGADWQTSPATQIRWGLGYIQGLYGSPCGAWAHEESAGWY